MVKLSKKCSHCKTLKAIQSFPIDNRIRDGHAYRCKECQKIFAKLHYQKYKHKYKANQKKNRLEKGAFIYNYKKTHPCVDCGEKDPIVLDFDHRNPEDKTGNISRMATNRTSIKNLKKEIAKCDLRCANCHRRRTAKQFGWYSYIG
jgi:lysozyme family protein